MSERRNGHPVQLRDVALSTARTPNTQIIWPSGRLTIRNVRTPSGTPLRSGWTISWTAEDSLGGVRRFYCEGQYGGVSKPGTLTASVALLVDLELSNDGDSSTPDPVPLGEFRKEADALVAEVREVREGVVPQIIEAQVQTQKVMEVVYNADQAARADAVLTRQQIANSIAQATGNAAGAVTGALGDVGDDVRKIKQLLETPLAPWRKGGAGPAWFKLPPIEGPGTAKGLWRLEVSPQEEDLTACRVQVDNGDGNYCWEVFLYSEEKLGGTWWRSEVVRLDGARQRCEWQLTRPFPPGALLLEAKAWRASGSTANVEAVLAAQVLVTDKAA